MLLAVPMLIGAVGLLGLEGYRIARPDSVLFVEPPQPSLVDAVRADALESAHAFLLAKTDPNQVVAFADETLTGGRTVMVSPLMVAVAARNGGPALMLLAFGAGMDLPQNARAACLAQELNETALAEAIRRDGRPALVPVCSPPLSSSVAPLLRYIEPALR